MSYNLSCFTLSNVDIPTSNNDPRWHKKILFKFLKGIFREIILNSRCLGVWWQSHALLKTLITTARATIFIFLRNNKTCPFHMLFVQALLNKMSTIFLQVRPEKKGRAYFLGRVRWPEQNNFFFGLIELFCHGKNFSLIEK